MKIIYPLTLPRPRVANIKSTERRLLTELVGARAARTIERDGHDVQKLEWTFDGPHMLLKIDASAPITRQQ